MSVVRASRRSSQPVGTTRFDAAAGSPRSQSLLLHRLTTRVPPSRRCRLTEQRRRIPLRPAELDDQIGPERRAPRCTTAPTASASDRERPAWRRSALEAGRDPRQSHDAARSTLRPHRTAAGSCVASLPERSRTARRHGHGSLHSGFCRSLAVPRLRPQVPGARQHVGHALRHQRVPRAGAVRRLAQMNDVGISCRVLCSNTSSRLKIGVPPFARLRTSPVIRS